MQDPSPSAPAPATDKWRRRALEALPAALVLLAALFIPWLWGAWPVAAAAALWLGPFAGLVVGGWTAQDEAYALRCVPVALASLTYPAIVFWIWPRWTERAGGMRAIALAVAALLWCATGYYTTVMAVV